MTQIYLDYASTAPLLPEVLDAMMPFFGGTFGNPSSVHGAGRKARYALENARESVAQVLGALPEEILFTSGGTEANYLAIHGCRGEGLVLTMSAEHEAVLQPVRGLGLNGRILATDAWGRADPDEVAASLHGVSLASFMLVNNEIGAVNDLPELASRCHSAGVVVHCDAVQAPAVMTLDVNAVGADLMSLSAHKMGGPKGTGLLYVRSGVEMKAPMPGGGQEKERRGGTENVAGIIGLAEALRLQSERCADRKARLARLNGKLRAELGAQLGDEIRFNSPQNDSASHILNVGVPGLAALEGSEMLVLGLDLEGVQVSAGSACSSGVVKPSHVLASIGRSADAAVRFSFGAATTEDEISRAAKALTRVIHRVKSTA